LAAEALSFSREFAKQAGEKKTKADKEDKIKKPKTAYIYFTLEARARVISDNPNSSFGEISKELGKRWREMSDVQKAPYVRMADAEREQWLKLKAK